MKIKTIKNITIWQRNVFISIMVTLDYDKFAGDKFDISYNTLICVVCKAQFTAKTFE